MNSILVGSFLVLEVRPLRLPIVHKVMQPQARGEARVYVSFHARRTTTKDLLSLVKWSKETKIVALKAL